MDSREGSSRHRKRKRINLKWLIRHSSMFDEKKRPMITELNLMKSSGSLSDMDKDGARIILNICGRKFRTSQKLLELIPNSRLAVLADTLKPDDDCIAFRTIHVPGDEQPLYEFSYIRDPSIFQSILNLYHNGQLHFCKQCCPANVRTELKFWMISEQYIAPCCLKWYVEGKNDDAYIRKMEYCFKRQGECQVSDEFKKSIRYRIWKSIDDPNYSRWSMIWGYCYLIIVLISIVLNVIDGLPFVRRNVTDYAGEQADDLQVTVNSIIPNQWTRDQIMFYLTTTPVTAVQVVERIIDGFFTLEVFCRLILCPQKLRFFRNLMNLADFLCVVVYWSFFTMQSMLPTTTVIRHYSIMLVFQCVLTLRIVRMFRFANKYNSLRALTLTFFYSWKEFALLFCLMLIGMWVYGLIIYYVEFMEQSEYDTVLVGMWWAIITMTTVGYGDSVPVSTLGRVVGVFCVLTGVTLVALPVPFVANRFMQFYNFAKMKRALKKDAIEREAAAKKNVV